MKKRKIEVLKVEPGKVPERVTLDNTLEALQDAVSIGMDGRGLIEIVELDESTCILCNEEGKLLGLEPNRRLGSDVLCGVFYVTGQDKHGNLCSLSEESMQFYEAYFRVPEIITQEEVAATLITQFFLC